MFGPLALALLALPLLGFSIGVRHIGQVLCSFNHITTHWSWNQCLQGNTVASSPSLNPSMQMVHSVLPSGPNISLSTFLRSSLRRASSVAGGAALFCGFCSINCEMMRSKAS